MKTPHESNQSLMNAITELHQAAESPRIANDILMSVLTGAMGSDWGTIADKNDLSNATALFWSIAKLIEAAEPFRHGHQPSMKDK